MNRVNKNFETVSDYLRSMENMRELIYSTFDFNELMNRLIVAASEAVNCDTAAISFREGENWILRYSYGFSSDVIGSIMNDDQKRHVLMTIKTKQPVIIFDTDEDDPINNEQMKIRDVKSVIIVPLISEKAIGAIVFNYYKSPQKFNQLVIEFIKTLSSSISLALQNVVEFQAHQTTLRRYQSLFDSIDEGFCVIDMIYDADGKAVDYRFVDVNYALEEIMGYENAKGKLRSDLNPDGEDYWLELYSKVVKEGNPIRYTNQSHDRWFSVYAFRVDESQKNYVGVLFKDVTEEVEARNEMEKAIKIQDEIFVNISHELKTPLNVIFSTIQLLEHNLKQDHPELKKKTEKSIKVIKQNCFRFTKLINNIVDHSKMDAGYLKLNLHNENIIKVVEDIVQSVSEFIASKGLGITFSSNVNEKIVACDAEKIERIMLNLISNAIKFSDKGQEIFVDVFDQGDVVEIFVRDTGVGMDQKHLNAIFNRFHQVDKTLSRNAEGSGIGLSIVKSIVGLHGGDIGVASELGKGTTVSFRIPAKLVDGDRVFNPIRINNSRIEMINIEFSDIYRL